jgi:predicted ATPase
MTGDFRQARPHLELAVSLYRSEEHRELAFRYGQDIGASALCYLSWAFWHDGYPDQALRTADRALLHAREFGHAYTLGHTLWHTVLPAVLSRDVQRVERLANENATISGEHCFPFFLAHCDVELGWVAAHQGQPADGIDRMRRGIAAAAATGSQFEEPFYLGLVAEALAFAGEIDQGLAELDQAVERSTETGERWADAELRRLRGDLLCRLPRPIRMAPTAPFAPPCRSPRSRAPGVLNCAPRRASRGFWATTGGARRRGNCWRRSTTGSPRGSTSPT